MSRGAIVVGIKTGNLSIPVSVRGQFLHFGLLHTEDFAKLHHFKQFDELSITIHTGNFLYLAPTPGSCPRAWSWGFPSNKDSCFQTTRLLSSRTR